MTFPIVRLRLCCLLVSLLLASCSQTDHGIIYEARYIVTMDNATPSAEAVLVKDGIIESLGSVADLKKVNPAAIVDGSLKELTIVPGFIDPHVHMILAALIYSRPFIPPWDMETPDGLVKAAKDKGEFLERLDHLEKAMDSSGPLIVYGYHNLIHGSLDRYDLDAISSSRPILVWHYSVHDFYLNSAAIEWAGVKKAWAKDIHGVALDASGDLTGRLYEDALQKLFEKLAFHLLRPSNIERGFSGFEAMLARAGVTSVVELGYGLFGLNLEDFYYWMEYSSDDPYHLYLVPEYRAFAQKYGKDAFAEIVALSENGFENGKPMLLPQVKFFSDGAFYSQTMKLDAPGYLAGQSVGSDGVWATEPKLLAKLVKPYWDAGLSLRIHSNGDAAQTATLDMMSILDKGKQHEDQRFVIEHGALINSKHIERLKALNGGVSAASHYVHHMANSYMPVIGDRVSDITPMGSLSRAGVPVSLHSDAPLAPPYPLQAAAVHIMRSTREGAVSTESESLSRKQALAAITIDAAWSMGLEKQLGTITVGKRANFTVLRANPLETEAQLWPQIGVWGVVLDGVLKPL